MKDFRDLQVWHKAHQATLEVYRLTSKFRDSERYGLTSQLRRSCSSMGANIAEGCGRGSDSDFRRFLHIAMGSASETEYHILLAKDLGYIEVELSQLITSQLQEVKKMLASLIRKLTADS